MIPERIIFVSRGITVLEIWHAGLPGVLCNTLWCSVLHSFSRKAVFSNRHSKCSVGRSAHRFIQWKFVLVAKLSISKKMSSPPACPCIGIPDVFHVCQHLSYNPLTKLANPAVPLLSELSSIYVVYNYKLIVIHNYQFIRSIICICSYMFRLIYGAIFRLVFRVFGYEISYYK